MEVASEIVHEGKKYIYTFEIDRGVHVYSNPESKSQYDDANGALLQFDDIFFNSAKKRPANEVELNEALGNLKVARIPNADVSSALVRVLSGVKPKRVSKAKSAVPIKVENDSVVEDDYDDEVDEEDEDDEEEDNEYEEEEEIEDDDD
jgi:hypothetical protein